MTLKNATDASDFKLNKFLMGPPECFEPYYGSGGADGDGDILKPENLEEFKDYVLQQTGWSLGELRVWTTVDPFCRKLIKLLSIII